MSDPILRREDPPASKRRVPSKRISWRRVAEQLRATPGEWHLIAEDMAASQATYVKNKYQLDTRLVGVSEDGNRAEKFYARHPLDEAQQD